VKVLIVGGGPAGSLSAIQIRKRGHDVILAEEHSSAGFPVQCAGLISKECYKKLREFVSSRCHLNDIKGAFFFSPDGNYLEMIGRSKAVVIERKILDSELLRIAAKYANVRLKTIFKGAENNKAIFQSSDFSTVEYDYLIGADGAPSAVARTFGFKRPDFFSALQFECEFEPLDVDMVELYFGSRYSDSFFGYSIPIDEETARIGVVSREYALHYLNNIIEKHPSVSRRVKKRRIIELNAGVIPIGLVDFVKDNIALIGDSAGMVKPYTGGGLYYHLVASEILGRVFPDLDAYKEAYIKKMGSEYRTGEKILRLYSSLSDEDYNKLVKAGRNENIGEIVKNLHMDSPSSLVKILPTLLKIFTKNPRLFAKAGKILM